MTTYYVDGSSGDDSNDGRSAQQAWRSLNKANASINNGDTVLVRNGTYQEVLNITKANTTWRADVGHRPVLDGGYGAHLFQNGRLPAVDAGPYLPGARFASMVSIRADNVIFDGFRVQNVAGEGIAVDRGGDNCKVLNCLVDFIFGVGIISDGTTNVELGYNKVSRCSRRGVANNVRVNPGRRQPVSGAVKFGNTHNIHVHHNIVAYGFGECMNCGKGNYEALVENNELHSCNHACFYNNHSIGTIFRFNTCYHTLDLAHRGEDGDFPAGILIGDEYARGRALPHSSGGAYYNNLVVGTGKLFQLRNSGPEGNYDTQADGLYVGFNTFVALQKTADLTVGPDNLVEGITIEDNYQGRSHRRSTFENNIIYWPATVGSRGRMSDAKNGTLNGIEFRNNCWSERPVAAMQGSGDQYGNPMLEKPDVLISGEPAATPETNFDPRNYRLTAASTLAIGKAGPRRLANGIALNTVSVDFFGNRRDASKPDIGAHEFAAEAAEMSAAEDEPPRITAASVIPLIENFRRFLLVQTSSQAISAYGVQFPNEQCVLIWTDGALHMSNYSNIEVIRQLLVVDGVSELVMIDPTEELPDPNDETP
jgi:hypothetical protein